MAITFIQQKKRQQYFLGALAVVFLVTAFVLWQGFFTKSGGEGPVIRLPQTIEIRFDVLEGEALKALDNPPEELILPQDVGKGNPFLP